ncbi:MAG: MmgE/PrpD family protein [Acetobacteraceae bacterium]|nr:MmgE/PrpD family protein [Acetobacteraceae bacterium]MDW8396941.1 MmgE/PrpD family protein [Acetobacteraceae bacterium]
MAIVTAPIPTATQLAAAPADPWQTSFAATLAATRWEALPAEVRERAALVLLDCIGAIAAGAQEEETLRLADALLLREGAGKEAAIGTPNRLSPGDAALFNGTAGTMLELDEGNQFCRGHPAIHVVPAILATARAAGASGADLLRALVLGYEAGARIGIASRLRVEMHPHGTWGSVAAAVGVAALHAAEPEELRQAMGLASSLGLATSRRTMLEGGTVRNAYAGIANAMGVLVWDLLRAGFAPERDGVASVFGGIAATGFDSREMLKDLGTRWEIARNYFKRHAACRYTHGALDAVGRILGEHGPIPPEAIRSVRVDTYVWAAQLDDPAPRNMLAAKFSVPYAVAAMLVRGRADVPAFREPALSDPAIRALAARISVEEDPQMTARLPGLRPARVTLQLADGRTLSAEALTNRGDAEDPFSPEELREKFRELAAPVFGAGRARAIEEAVLALPEAEDCAALDRLLTREAA